MSVTTASTEPYMAFVLTVDDLEWTKHWLGRLRCDEIIVFIARNENVSPRIRIRAVESKAVRKTDPVSISATTEPFAEGVEQVTATLDALWQIISPSSSNALVEDLRFTSFIEHLASVALSSLHPILLTDADAQYAIKCISDFSSRTISPPDDVQLDGAVICTQYRGAASYQARWENIEGDVRSWAITLVRAGTGELDRLLGKQMRLQLAEPENGEPPSPDTPPEKPDSGPPTAPQPETALGTELRDAQVTEPEPVPSEEKIPIEKEAEEAATGISLARDLFLACIHRGFPLEEPDIEKVTVAPALYSVSMALRAGASIRPIENALDDLAREVGVPSISVENDPSRPYHLRFVIARRDRQFPELPDQQAPLSDVDSQSYLGLYLGSTLDGRDFNSFVSSWPHMLVGGTTGSGKTTFIRSLLTQMNRIGPEYLKALIVDGKGEIDYINVLKPNHFVDSFPEVILGHVNVMPVFEWLLQEEIPSRREKLLARAKEGMDKRPHSARELYVQALVNGTVPLFAPILVVIDEFAEIMLGRGTEAQKFEQAVQQITQVGRSVLIHLLLATQRPDANVISGAVKANLDARIALRLPTHHDSMTILGTKGAERLTGKGDLLFQSAGQPVERLQAYNS
jgi:hypothetical protein